MPISRYKPSMTHFSFRVVQSVKTVLTAAIRIYQIGRVKRNFPATLKIKDRSSIPIETPTDKIIIVIFNTSFVLGISIIPRKIAGVKCANSKEESIWK